MHVENVHINPLKHGLVKAVHAWPYSTFHRYVTAGAHAGDWAGGEEADGLGHSD